MNLLLFDLTELDPEGRLRLTDRRAQHLLEVLGVEPGQTVRVAACRGQLGRGVVEQVDQGKVTLAIELKSTPPPTPRVDLILALPRPKVLGRAIEAAACCGVRRIDLVRAWRVEKAYFSSPRLAEAVLAAHARRGCEQGGQSWVPEIGVHRLFSRFLEQVLAPRIREDASCLGLLAHPRSGLWIEQLAGSLGDRPVVLAVGPEGGWIEREIESFCGLGFLPVAISGAVLRVEQALTAALCSIELVRRLGRVEFGGRRG